MGKACSSRGGLTGMVAEKAKRLTLTASCGSLIYDVIKCYLLQNILSVNSLFFFWVIIIALYIFLFFINRFIYLFLFFVAHLLVTLPSYVLVNGRN